MVAMIKRTLNFVQQFGRALHPETIKTIANDEGNKVVYRDESAYAVTFVSASAASFAPAQTKGISYENKLVDIADRPVQVVGDVSSIEAYEGWTLDDFVAWYIDGSDLVTKPNMYLHNKTIYTDDEGRQYIDVPLYANGTVPADKSPSLFVIVDEQEVPAFARLYRYSTLAP